MQALLVISRPTSESSSKENNLSKIFKQPYVKVVQFKTKFYCFLIFQINNPIKDPI